MLRSFRVLSLAFCLLLPAFALDLKDASVVAPANFSGPERKAVEMLVEEVATRTLIAWPVATPGGASSRRRNGMRWCSLVPG